jgi:hypothetical protein
MKFGLHEISFLMLIKRDVSWLRQLVAGFPSRRPGFDPRSAHVGFIVEKVELV